MMKNDDQSVKVNHNLNDNQNVLLNLIKHQLPDTDKSQLYVKNSFESKSQLLMNGRENVKIKKLKNPKAFIDYSQTMDDIYEIWKTIIQKKKGEFQ